MNFMKMFSQKNKKPSSVVSGKDEHNFEDLVKFELTTKKSHSEHKSDLSDQSLSKIVPKDFKKARKPNIFEKLKVMG
jgi:hypothetical protein